VLFVGRLRRGNPPPLAEFRQCGAVAKRPLAGGVKGEMQYPARRLQRRKRPGMHFAENGGAQRMRGQPCAVIVPDGDFNSHVPPVARDRSF
jgi:hypothetical protein